MPKLNYKTLRSNNDPLGQTYSHASSDHYSHLKVVLFCCEILKSGTDRRADVQTPSMKVVIIKLTLGRPRGSLTMNTKLSAIMIYFTNAFCEIEKLNKTNKLKSVCIFHYLF